MLWEEKFKPFSRVCLVILFATFCNLYAGKSQLPDNQDKTIKIGLLLPDSNSIAARQGADIAINEANAKGGMKGRPFQLVVRSMEGPWGTGSRETVDLIFEEKVWAILGSHDGRNAHLVEQAATKTHVIFLSAWAGDPTLSQAFVPWFFNCVPNDRQQAEALIDEIYTKRKIDRIAIISDNDYDSKQAVKNLMSIIKTTGKNEPAQLVLNNSDEELNVLLDKINVANVSCIIIFCRSSASLKIIRQIRKRNMSQPLFGSLSLLNENVLSEQDLQVLDDLLLIPSGNWPLSKSSAFILNYRRLYGQNPGMVAHYAYDGMNLLIEAIKEAGAPEREMIQKSLQEIHYEGVTGLIQFDDKGNRMGPFKITHLKNGIPVIF